MTKRELLDDFRFLTSKSIIWVDKSEHKYIDFDNWNFESSDTLDDFYFDYFSSQYWIEGRVLLYFWDLIDKKKLIKEIKKNTLYIDLSNFKNEDEIK